MGRIDTYLLREAWGILKAELQEKGYCLRRGVSFEQLEERIVSSEKPRLTEHFSTEQNTYAPSFAFWICIETMAGEVVGRVAARIDKLDQMSLLDYWRKYWRRCYPGVSDGRAQLAESQPRFASKISGNVVYVGDLFIESAHRKNGIGSCLVKIVQIDALDEWVPDYLYGWMLPEHVGSRLFPSYGFRAVHSNGIRWEIPPGTIGGNLTFVGNSHDDLADLLEEIAISRNV